MGGPKKGEESRRIRTNKEVQNILRRHCKVYKIAEIKMIWPY
jgi:hypothetical protein